MKKTLKRILSIAIAFALLISLNSSLIDTVQSAVAATIEGNDPFSAMYDSESLIRDELEVINERYSRVEQNNDDSSSELETASPVRTSGFSMNVGSNDSVSEKADSRRDKEERRIRESLTPDRYIVKYRNSSSVDISSMLRGRVKKAETVSNNTDKQGGPSQNNGRSEKNARIEVLTLNERTNPQTLANELRQAGADREIEYIQPDFTLSLESLQIETSSSSDDESASDDGSGFPNMKDTVAATTGKNTVIVAVLDTGIDSSHPTLNGYMLEGWNFPASNSNTYDQENPLSSVHGTHIAGVIAENARSYGADIKILPLQVFENGKAYTSDILAAIQFAVDSGAQIINCSFGTTSENKALEDAIKNASDTLFVAAAGNNRSDLDEKPAYPAAYRLGNLISVGSVNADGGFSYFSNYSVNSVDITALGRDVKSAFPEGEFETMSGTSTAASQVSAAAAVLAANSDGQASTLRTRLLNSADKLDNLLNKVSSGRRLNINNALSNVSGQSLSINPANDFDVHEYVSESNDAWELYGAFTGVTQIAVGEDHSLALKSDGTVWAWGNNSYGQLGDGTFNDRAIPVRVIGLTGVTAIAAGRSHSLAISGGAVYAWGWNSCGQIGDGTYSIRTTPYKVGLTGTYTLISAGDEHSIARRSTGTVYGWGDNWYGQLGKNWDLYYDFVTPTQISSLASVTKIASGSYHNLAYTTPTTGSLTRAWGSNWYFQLGNGKDDDSYNLVTASGLSSGITVLAAGDEHSLAIKSGAVYAWGYGADGRLGNTANWNEKPAQVAGMTTGVTAIAAGFYHSLAVKSGVVWAWGYNGFGQLGDGTTTTRYSPVQVAGLSGTFTAVAAGWGHNLALKSDGTVWAWGDNRYGQLGDGTEDDRFTAVQVQNERPPSVATTLKVTVNPNTLQIPSSGSVSTVLSSTVYDQYGYAMSGAVTYSLSTPYTGVSVNATTGAVTVTADAQQGVVNLKAASGSLTATTQLTLTAPPEEDNNDIISKTVVESFMPYNGLHNSGTVSKNGKVWYGIRPQASSEYEVSISSDNAEVYVYDSDLMEVAPNNGRYSLQADEAYYVCIVFSNVSSSFAYTLNIDAYVNVIPDYWNYYGELRDEKPEHWVAIKPEIGGLYNLYAENPNGAVSGAVTDNTLTPLVADDDGNVALSRENQYFIKVTSSDVTNNDLTFIINMLLLEENEDEELTELELPDDDSDTQNFEFDIPDPDEDYYSDEPVDDTCEVVIPKGITWVEGTPAGDEEGDSDYDDGVPSSPLRTPASFGITAAASTTVKFQITYDLNGAPGSLPSHPCKSINHVFPNYAWKGYELLGWSLSPKGGNIFQLMTRYDFSDYSDKTFYAIWAPIKYTATYYANQGVGAAQKAQSNAEGKLTIASSSFTRTGYSFLGWNTKANGTGLTYLPGDIIPLTAPLNLYAQWLNTSQRTVTYFGNGSDKGNVPAPQAFTAGKKFSLRGAGTMAKSGHKFMGWSLSPNGTGQVYKGYVTFTENSDLYAVWEIDYKKITYTKTGANSGNAPNVQPYQSGASVVLSANTGNLTKTGNDFVGWKKGSLVFPAGKPTDQLTGNVTLYPKWEPKTLYVTYNSNGGSGYAPSEQAVKYALSFRTSINTGLTKPYHTFNGWNTQADGKGRHYAANGLVTLKDNAVLYAEWKPITYSITYNSNGGTGSVAKQTIAYPFTTGVKDSGSMKKAGYYFTNWNTDKNGNGTPYSPGVVPNISSNITLYAQWAPGAFVVTYIGNGNTGGVAPANHVFTAGVPFNVNGNTGNLVKEHNMLEGWSTSSTGTKKYNLNQSITLTASITLYAKWAPINYTLTYYGNGQTSGTVPAAKKANAGAAFALNSGSLLKRTNYIFGGWNTQADGKGTTYSGGSNISLTADKALYALWIPDTCTLTYSDYGADFGSKPSEQTANRNSSVTVAGNPGNLQKIGFTFAGWSTGMSGTGTVYQAGNSIKLATNTILYPKWTANTYTVTYNGNGCDTGSVVPSKQTFINGNSVKLAPDTNMQKKYSVFSEWNTLSSGTGNGYAANATVNFTGDVQLYAIWKPATVTVSYDANGANGTVPSNQTITGGGKITLSDCGELTSTTGFLNWNTQADGEGTTFMPGQIVGMDEIKRSIKLYAIWASGSSDTGGNSSSYPANPKDPSKIKTTICEGDPVNIVTGSLSWEYTDIALYGAEELAFTRTYNSRDNYSGTLGNNWRHNFDYSLDANTNDVAINMPNGQIIRLTKNTDGSYAPPVTSREELEKTSSGYVMTGWDKTKYNFNNNGQLINITYPNGNTTTLEYDNDKLSSVSNRNGTLTFSYSDGKITSVSDTLGRSVTLAYSDNNLISVKNADGDSLKYEYSGKLLTAVTDFNNAVYLKNVYDENGSVIEQFMAGQGTSYFSYDTDNRVTTFTDAKGNISKYYYDENGIVTLIEDEDGQVQRTFNESGSLLSETDRLGNTTSYTYDAAGNIASVAYPDGTSERFEYNNLNLITLHEQRDGSSVRNDYDSRGNITSYTDASGKSSNYTYDNDNNMLSSTDPLSNTTIYTYDSNGNCLTQTDPMDNVTAFEYDTQGRLIRQTNADTSTIEYEYSTAGKLVKVTDAMGYSQTYSVNGNGFTDGITDQLGNKTAIAYNEQNKPISVTDARGNTTMYQYDVMGSISKTTDSMGNSVSYGYDSKGRITSMTDARGNTWHYEYDAEGRMTKATDPLSNATSYSYDVNGQVTSIVSPLGNTQNSSYDSMGRLVRSSDPEGNETSYEYDSLGRLISIKNADGTSVTYTYNANGWLTSSADESGAVTAYTYNKNGQMLTITDAVNGVTSYEYDSVGRIVSETDALNGTTSYTYDKNGNLLTSTDAMGFVTTISYDELNRVSTVTDAMDGITEYEYDANSNIVKVTNADGGVTTYSYDANNRLVSYTDAEGNTFSFSYDANGNQIGTIDGRGNSSHTTFDALNRPTSLTDEAGNTASVEYDADGRIVKSVGKDGAVTSYTYDKNSNIIKVTDAYGNSKSFTYDAMNRVTSMSDERGAVTHYSYSPTGNITSITDAEGGVSHYEYDLLGRLTAYSDELGRRTIYAYDKLGRVTSVTNPLGYSDSFTYDANGRITTVTDRNGNMTKYVYDANGNIIETIDAAGHSSYFEYDVMNRLTKVRLYRDGEQQVTLYSYDKRGLVSKEINAAGIETSYSYDSNGNLIQKTDADGNVTTLGYDARNLAESINYSDSKTVTFAYNANGSLVEMNDWNGKTTFELDLLDRIVSVKDHNDKNTSYSYDDAGNQISMTYPDGTTVNYEYDLLGRMTSVNDGQSTVYEYDAAGQLVSQIYPNGWKDYLEYDAAGQLTRVLTDAPVPQPWNSQFRLISYDPMGNIMDETNPEETNSYFYDELNRLVYSNGNTYEYDSLGNLVRSDEEGVQTTYTYNNLNQQISKTVNGATVTNTFDKRGNLIGSSDGASYIYDATNRMVKGTTQNGVSEYNFNGLGYLAETTSNGVKKSAVIDFTSPLKNVIMESEADNLTYKYVNGIRKVSVTVGDDKLFYHLDRLGSVRMLTDTFGEIKGITNYDAWGVPTLSESVDVDGKIANLLKTYTGHTYDSVLDMYFAQARMYDPNNMRFTSVDPVKGSVISPMSLVQYAYVLDNPLKYVDPFGLVKIYGHEVTSAIYGTAFGGGKNIYIEASEVMKLWATIVGLGDITPQTSTQSQYKTSNITPNKNVAISNYINLVQKNAKDKSILSVNARYSNGMYFVKLSCFENMLSQAGYKGKATERNKYFDASQYTGAGGRQKAVGLADNLLANGSFTPNAWDRFTKYTYGPISFGDKTRARALQTEAAILIRDMYTSGFLTDMGDLVDFGFSDYKDYFVEGWNLLTGDDVDSWILKTPTDFGLSDVISTALHYFGSKSDSKTLGKKKSELKRIEDQYNHTQTSDFRYFMRDTNVSKYFNIEYKKAYDSAVGEIGKYSVFVQDYMMKLELNYLSIYSINVPKQWKENNKRLKNEALLISK